MNLHKFVTQLASCFAMLLLGITIWISLPEGMPSSIVLAQESFSCANVSEIPLAECAALVAIYEANASAPQDLPNWLTTNSPCGWDAIRCSSGHVTSLYFSTGQLSNLPADIGNLTSLESYTLFGNGLTTLPPEIGSLTNLEVLKIFNNPLTSLPAEIGNLTNLGDLAVFNGALTSLPPEIGNLTNLTQLMLAENNLASLPAEIGNLTSLSSSLIVDSNELTSLPSEIGNLVNLSALYGANNRLTSLPVEIGLLSSLMNLEVSNNPLESQPVQINVSIQGNGTITRDIPGPFYVAGTNVQLTAVPDQGWTLQSATCQNAADFVEFEDGVDLTLGEQNAACTIVFTEDNTGGNEFSCADVSEIPQTECEVLVAMGSANSSFGQADWFETNTPCSWQGVQCSNGSIVALDLDDRGLDNLPSTIENLANLSVLSLDFNNLPTLPSEIGNLTNLTSLQVPFNGLDSLPPEIGNLANLLDLNVSYNNLVSLPSEIGTLTNLTQLVAVENRLTSLPTEIGNLTNLIGLYVRDNNLTSLPAEIGYLSLLEELDVQNNPLDNQPVRIATTVLNNGSLDPSVNVGAIERSISGPFYVEGTSIELTAVPAAGYDLVRWFGRQVGDQAEQRTILITATEGDDEYVADFYRIPEPTACGPLEQEAELGARSGKFMIGSDGSASGGQYIYVLENEDNVWAGPDGVNQLRFCVNVPEDGLYRIKASTAAMGEFADSFYVQVNDAPASGYLWDTPAAHTFEASYVGDRGGMNPVELMLSAGEQTVSFFLRESGTRLDKFALEKVSAEPPVTECSGLEREAEAGALTGDFAIGSDGAASGSQYIYVPNASGNAWDGPSSLHKADYCFTVEDAGTYRVKGWVYGNTDLDDSFYVQVDGNPNGAYLWDTLLNDSYMMDYVSDRDGMQPVILSLTPGEHRVTVYLREDGTRLDKLALEPLDVASSGELVCDGLTREAEDGLLTGDFMIGDDAAASGGHYIYSINGAGNEWQTPNDFRKAEYCFTVDQAGEYVIAADVYGTYDLDDSFYVRVDDDSSRTFLWDTSVYDRFGRDYVSDRNGADPETLSLAAGEHRVTVYLREDGSRLDTLALEPAVGPIVAAERDGTLTARGVYGEILVQQSMAQTDAGPDYSGFSLTLSGANYSRTVDVLADGTYAFDNMPIGAYTLRLTLPDGYVAITPAELTVTALADAVVRVSPDVMRLQKEQFLFVPFMMQ